MPHAPDLVFEIGTEELPAAYLPELIEQLRADAQERLRAAHLAFARVQAFGTPRRLVLVVRALATSQYRPAEEIRGPAKQAAFDAHGKPTPALLGFLRSRGGTLSQTKLVETDRGAYVYLVTPPRAAPTARVLPTLLAELIGGLRAPKTMRWDAGQQRFARPIRWLLALHGTRAIPCCLGAVRSGSTTRLGRPMALRSARVGSAAQYFRVLQRAGILLDHSARRARIDALITRAARQAGGHPAQELIRHGLLEEVTFLTEQPAVIVGGFDRTYLTLPQEVLLASMAKHQRVFAVESGRQLRPRFVGVLEGPASRPQRVRAVMERILNARLADSLLFWEQDRRRPLGERDVSGVALHERLGSMADKTKRLLRLGDILAEAWDLAPQEREALKRACRLAKADLVTAMVKEFPTLQGVMGKHYALAGGESPEVAAALEEQYLPAAGRCPGSLLGSALAILDKYDTLTGYFALNIEPTGDQDPFGLRRAAQGIIETLWEMRRAQRAGTRRLPLDELFRARATMAPFIGLQPARVAAVGQRVRQYLLERLYSLDWRLDGGRASPGRDMLDAVLSSPCHDLLDVLQRIEALQRVRPEELLRAAKVLERTRNILKGEALSQQQVDPARLQEQLERRLWELYTAHRERVAELAARRSYTEATALYGGVFYQPLHEFFDRVMVNVPDEALRQNRLALMQAIRALYTERIADLSKLTVVQQREPA